MLQFYYQNHGMFLLGKMQKHSLITQTKKPTFRLLKSIQDPFYTGTQKITSTWRSHVKCTFGGIQYSNLAITSSELAPRVDLRVGWLG